MSNPFFSIIVPVYKVEKYLEQCIRSVLNQSCDGYELILVDDGSPDNCPVVCDNFAEIDSHIRVVHKKNGGLSDARNCGLAAAKGEYIIFLDSDDFWCDNEGLNKIYNKLVKENADVLIFGMKKYFQNEEKYTEIRVPACDEVDLSCAQGTKKLMEGNIFVACACDKVVRRTLIEENGMSFVVGQLSEDIEWCSKLLLCKPSITVLSETLYVYRQQNSGSITANIGRRNLEHICEVLIKYSEIGRREDNIELLNFMAEQYVLWMTVSTLVSRKEISDLLGKIKKYWYLMSYNWYPHVKLVRKVSGFGFWGVRWLLGMYKKFNIR